MSKQKMSNLDYYTIKHQNMHKYAKCLFIFRHLGINISPNFEVVQFMKKYELGLFQTLQIVLFFLVDNNFFIKSQPQIDYQF